MCALLGRRNVLFINLHADRFVANKEFCDNSMEGIEGEHSDQIPSRAEF